MTIKIGTLNSRGGDSKTYQIFNFLNKNKLDICLIQEIHNIKDENVSKIERESKSKIHRSPGTQNSRGVMTVIKMSEIIQNSRVTYKDTNGNYLVVEVEIENEIYEIVNIYAPMTPARRAELFTFLDQDSNGKTNRIIGGDWNVIENYTLDCTGGSKNNFDQRRSDRKKMQEFRTKNGYLDSFRLLHPMDRKFTFTGISNYKSRLDRIYVHNSTITKITNADIIPAVFTDHDLFTIHLQTCSETERVRWGQGLWKLNKTLLENNENWNELKNLWITHQNEKIQYEDLLDWWEMGKRKIKEKCIELGKSTKKKTNDKKDKLMQELQKNTKSTDPQTAKRILELKKRLNEIEESENKGAMVRSRTQWQTSGEKCTKFFFNLEKSNANDKQMRQLQDDEGHVYKGKSQIMDYVRKFYEKKFMATDLDDTACNTLLNAVSNTLSDDQRDEQAGFFTMEELESVKKKMNRGKSPGSDGITVEFYDMYWNIIKDDLLDVINEIGCVGKMPLSMTQAAIVLIYKNKGSRENLKNWRAISLLNTDFKFLTAMIANRIEPYLPYLIHDDQSCSVRGRNMEDSLIYINDLIEHIRQFGGKTFLYGLDLEAAFDNLEHEYMLRLMERYNFGYKIRDLMKIIYKNMYSCVVINGAKTPYFKLFKSCRQGDYLSMPAFVLAAETLANIIRQDNQMHKVILPNTRPKCISQYCDDTVIMSTNVKDIARISTHMRTFEMGTGSKFNIGKSEILLLGEWSEYEKLKFPQNIVKQCIKILGLWIGQNAVKLNKEHILLKTDTALNFWKSIPLSFDGKHLIITTKVLPVLYHVIRITGLDKSLKKEIQRRITEFIWHPRKMNLLPYSLLQNSIQYGGLGMPNLDVIHEAILTERIPKVLSKPRIWTGTFIYRLGFDLRALKPDFASAKYAHCRTQTPVTEIIKATYHKLAKKVSDWTTENFKSLKQKLHENNDYRKNDPTRDYSNTWLEIRTSTDDRKSRDNSYLAAHDALPLAAILKRRGITADDKCRLCGSAPETREHLFIKCRLIQTTKQILLKYINRGITEELLLYHCGRGVKMKRIEKNAISAFKHSVWIIRGKIFYGEITGEKDIQNSLINLYILKLGL